MCPQYGELRPTNGSDRFESLGHPNYFQRLPRLGSVTAWHVHVVVGVSQILRRWTEGATYVRQGDHHVGHWPTFLVWHKILLPPNTDGWIAFIRWLPICLHVTHASFHPPESTIQMASRLVQPFMHSSWQSLIRHVASQTLLTAVHPSVIKGKPWYSTECC